MASQEQTSQSVAHGSVPHRPMNSVRLFTLEGARKQNPAVEKWFSGPPAELRSVARRWFLEMRSAGPDVFELLHDGHPTACVDDLALGYVNVFTAHVNVGFFFGATLRDPAKILEGTGRYMRHVKVRPRLFAQEPALRELLVDAYADIKARLAND
jgi:hypothetical protein